MTATSDQHDNSPTIRTRLRSITGQVWEYLRQNRLEEALKLCQRLLPLIERTDDMMLTGDVLIACAATYRHLGDEAESDKYIYLAFRLHEEAKLVQPLQSRLEEARRENELVRQQNAELEAEINRRKAAEFELMNRAQQLDILRQMDEDMSNILDMDTVALLALDSVIRLSGAAAGIIAVTRNENVVVAQYQGGYPFPIGQSIEPGQGIIGRVMVHQHAELVLDVTTDPDYSGDIPGVQAVMSLPLLARERLVGIIQVETIHQQHFSQELLDFMKPVAGRVAVALENAALYAYISRQLQELQRLYEKVSRLERLKTDMIRIGAHDLKNPLNAVMLYLDLFQKDKARFSARQDTYLTSMQAAVQQMRDLVNDILSLERIEALAEQAVMTPIDLAVTVQMIFERHRTQAHHKQQSILLRLDETSVPVRGDEAQLAEAIANLIGNAIKYTPDGGAITVSLRREEKNALLEVTDTGYGIPTELQSSIFQPFYRASTVETQHIIGTGLGLHLVRNIVDRHDGSMIFRSEYHRGSTFGFTLPVLEQ